jgi:hypothetical protein
MKSIKILFFIVIVIFFYTCKKDEVSEKYNISGYVQKGPFVSGSQITVQELDNSFTPTGKTYQTVISDDFGSFTLNPEISSPNIEIIATGFYYNEVNGELSEANITLRTIAEIEKSSNINVNILTTLVEDRIKYLITKEGNTFSAAKNKAEKEILAVFNITNNIASFDQLNISKDGEGNAVLLAISALLQYDNSEAELSELISKLSTDIKNDGKLDDADIKNKIKLNNTLLSINRIRINMKNRYSALGLSISVPAFEDYLDFDGDDTLNMLDQDQYILVNTGEVVPWSTDDYGKISIFKNKLWAIVTSSGSTYEVWSSANGTDWKNDTILSVKFDAKPAIIEYNNKLWLVSNSIWNSEDGKNWIKVSDYVPWTYLVRITNTCEVFKNKLFVIANSYRSGNLEYDVFSTTDGTTWNIENNEGLWRNRINSSTYVFNSKIWLCGGNMEIESSDYLNDIWYSDNGSSWTQAYSPNSFEPTWGHTSEIFDDKVWVISTEGIWCSDNGTDFKYAMNTPVSDIYPFYTSCEFDNKMFLITRYRLSSTFPNEEYSDIQISYLIKFSDWMNM